LRSGSRTAALAAALLAAACGTADDRGGTVARLALLESRGDVVSLEVEAGVPVVVVQRERGIGRATLELEGAGWPGELEVALEGFRNLESFAACCGGRCVETDLRSAPRARLREGRDERWATDVDLPVRVLPGSIRVVVPAAAVAGAGTRLELRWVDEYRE